MKLSTDRILTTHGGSLTRPAAIINQMRRVERGEPYDKVGLTREIRSCVREIVQRQADCELDVPSDGEQGKTSFYRYAFNRLSGMHPVGDTIKARSRGVGRDRLLFREFYAQYDPLSRTMWMPPEASLPEDAVEVIGLPESHVGWVCTDAIRYTGHEQLQLELSIFREALESAGFTEAFVAAGSPTVLEYGADNHFYPDRESYLFALAEAIGEEYRAIVESGFLLQIDAPEIADAYDRMMGEGLSQSDYNSYAELAVEAINYALRGIPEDRVRFHICWGSWNGPHTNDVPLREILHILLKVRAQAYYVEAANPRHEHEWEVWRDNALPEGKLLIPGVISHSTNVVEHPDLVSMRIKRFAKLVGRERIIAGTDCGFSQGWNSPRVHTQIQWAKLRALSQGAARASRELWRRG